MEFGSDLERKGICQFGPCVFCTMCPCHRILGFSRGKRGEFRFYEPAGNPFIVEGEATKCLLM